jgi:hypothetical protein
MADDKNHTSRGKFKPGNQAAAGRENVFRGGGPKPNFAKQFEAKLWSPISEVSPEVAKRLKSKTEREVSIVELALHRLAGLVAIGDLDAIKYTMDRALGKPKQQIQLRATGIDVKLTVHEAKAAALKMLAGAAAKEK